MTQRIVQLSILFSLFISSSLCAQHDTHIKGDILAKLTGLHASEKIVKDLTFIEGHRSTGLEIVKQISKSSNIWLFHFDIKSMDENVMLRYFKQHANVLEAQYNHKIQERSKTPNDPSLGQQWQWINNGGNNATADADVDAELAWDITTGGLTATGDTIVACVVDDGIALTHPDLIANLWKNTGEIPNDGIDNDGNGYIDDYNGWNINSDNDAVGSGGHGVNVAGMIGATGNNGVGVTGINWNVKIMTVRYGALTEAEVIEAYEYPLTMRNLYNATNGKKGAYVVVTNSSWGIDNADPTQYPLWCSFYDTMGAAGILSCAATTNNNANVDVKGDMPTACKSDYMIGVGRTTKKDEVEGGTGPINVDLGAPGVSIYTTSASAYTTTSGTSFASPLVAGIVALMYSVPCTDIATLSKKDPAQAAKLIKKYLLEGVDKKPNMTDTYLTGGRANAFNSVQLVLQNCGACQSPTNIVANPTSDTTAKLSWVLPDSVLKTKIQYRLLGSSVWTTLDNLTGTAYNLTGLKKCTSYEVHIASYCKDTLSDYSNILEFTSLGCCKAASNIVASDITADKAILSWDAVFGIEKYFIEYKKSNDATFTEIIASGPETKLLNLSSCTKYDVFILVKCDSNTVVTSDTISFNTIGCGACEDQLYCDAFGSEFQEEWISNVTLNGISNQSENDGYKLFTATGFVFNPLDSNTISVTPAYSGASFDEYIKVWVDFNHDGDFDDEGEIIFNPGPVSTAVTGKFKLPSTALPGKTRMRVALSFAGFGGDEPLPCGEIIFGEVEDYCVEIPNMPPPVCEIPLKLDTLSIGAHTAKLTWAHPAPGAKTYTLQYRPMGSTIWTTLTNILAPPVNISNLLSSTPYEWQIQSICTIDSSGYSVLDKFITDKAVSTTYLNLSNEISIYPNPSKNIIDILIKDEAMHITQIVVSSIDGKVLLKNQVDMIHGKINEINISELSSGMYFIILQSQSGNKYVTKLIKE